MLEISSIRNHSANPASNSPTTRPINCSMIFLVLGFGAPPTLTSRRLLDSFQSKTLSKKTQKTNTTCKRTSKYLLYTQQYSCHEHHSNNSDGIHHQTQNILFHNHSFFPLDKYQVTVTSSPPTKSSGVMSKEDSRHSAASSAQPRVRAWE